MLFAGANKLVSRAGREVNRLAVEQFVPTFGRPNLYRAASPTLKKHGDAHPGRALFADDLDVAALRAQLERGARIRATKLTEKFDDADYRARYGERARPLFLVDADRRLQVVTAEKPPSMKIGQTVLALVEAEAELG